MNDREKALADAIRKLAEARKALYYAARVYDDAAGEKMLGYLDRDAAVDATVYGIHEGEMDAYARTVESIARHLRSLRKTERQRI